MKSSQPLSTGQKLRYALYSLAICVAFFAVLDGALVWLERSGHVDLARDDDAPPLTNDPWQPDGQGFLVPTNLGRSPMPEHRIAEQKVSGTFRVMMAGASFLRGVPYEGPGTIHFWLKEHLTRLYPERLIEVANGAMNAMNSTVVRKVAAYAVTHEPDVLIVATCNNEGTLPPSKVTEHLQSLGTFRFLRKTLKGERAERPLHTPQDPDVEAVRANFRQNLEAIVADATYRGVPVLLCTLPVHYRYAGDAAGLPLEGHAWEDHGTVAEPPCVLDARAHETAGRMDAAEAVLTACEHIDAVRALGLLRFRQGRFDAARQLLTEYTEHVPRNRCRPSFNQVIREVASAHERVYLVDLAALVEGLAPHGMPGFEAFVDYCHLNWQTQAKVAERLVEVMLEAGVAPRLGRVAPGNWDREAALRAARTALGLSPLPAR